MGPEGNCGGTAPDPDLLRGRDPGGRLLLRRPRGAPGDGGQLWAARNEGSRTRPTSSRAFPAGSFTAAYFGLFGDRIFEDFEQRFLKKDIQSALLSRIILNPINWFRLSSPFFDRSELAAEYYDENVFRQEDLRGHAQAQRAHGHDQCHGHVAGTANHVPPGRVQCHLLRSVDISRGQGLCRILRRAGTAHAAHAEELRGPLRLRDSAVHARARPELSGARNEGDPCRTRWIRRRSSTSTSSTGAWPTTSA